MYEHYQLHMYFYVNMNMCYEICSSNIKGSSKNLFKQI